MDLWDLCMKMEWNMLRSSRHSQCPDCFKTGDDKSGVHQPFGGMPTTDADEWRSPSRILEVTIHRVCYPITEELLHQVFSPFGDVEQVHVFGGSEQVLANVVFKTKHEAAEAFGELHGWYVYDACCQLDIKWGPSQQCAANWDVRCCNTTSNSSSDMLRASTTSSICKEHVLDTDMVVATMEAIDVVPGVMAVEMSTACSTLGLDVNTEANHAAATFMFVKAAPDYIPAPEESKQVLSPKLDTDININADVLSTCSMECRGTLGVLVSANDVEDVPMPFTRSALLIFPTFSLATLRWKSLVTVNLGAHQALAALPLHNEAFYSSNTALVSICLSGSTQSSTSLLLDIMLSLQEFLLHDKPNITLFSFFRESVADLLPHLAMCFCQQPWLSPMHLKVICFRPDLRPYPWPSFALAEWLTTKLCYYKILATMDTLSSPRLHKSVYWGGVPGTHGDALP